MMEPTPSSTPSVSSAGGTGFSVTSEVRKAASGKMSGLMGHIPVAEKPLRTLEGVQALTQAFGANSGSMCSVICLCGCMRV